MTKEERLEKQRLRLIEMKVFENELYADGVDFVAGVDEVGRGPLAGPVVSACVVLPKDFDVLGVDDSKKLSEKKRDELFDIILEKAVCYGVGVIDNNIIDEINILQATKLAMRQAIQNADEQLAQCMDGAEIQHVLFDAMEIQEVQKPQQKIIKGDAKSVSIAAASIVAKVTRDRMMVELAETYPYYAFESNKGYGTKAHYEGIANHGITPIHRKSFLKNIL